MDLERQQLDGLWLAGHPPLVTKADAVRFMKSVGFALRYNATASLPLAAMYKAAGDTRRAIELTNAVLAGGDVVESNVIAGRLVLIHAERIPAVYALRTRHRSQKRTPIADRVFRFVDDENGVTAGDVRRFLGVTGQNRPDPGDLALAELQRDLWIDRGPSRVPKKGIPYLSPEGFPYRIFKLAHPRLVEASTRLQYDDAACSIIVAYLRAAVFVTPRKLSSMFRLLLSHTELEAALKRLEEEKKISRSKKYLCKTS